MERAALASKKAEEAKKLAAIQQEELVCHSPFRSKCSNYTRIEFNFNNSAKSN